MLVPAGARAVPECCKKLNKIVVRRDGTTSALRSSMNADKIDEIVGWVVAAMFGVLILVPLLAIVGF